MAILNQEVLATLDLKVLTIQRTVAGRWWNFRKVISPFSRLWLIMDGYGIVRHHGDLGAVAGLAGHGPDLDHSVGNLGDLLLKQAADKLRRLPAKESE